MSKRLFIGGLPYSVTSAQLGEMFAPFGKVLSADVISDKFTGQSKGFGFIDMENDTEADEAIKNLNEKDIEGRKIAVNVAKPREERGPRDFDRNRGGGGGGGGFGYRQGGFRRSNSGGGRGRN